MRVAGSRVPNADKTNETKTHLLAHRLGARQFGAGLLATSLAMACLALAASGPLLAQGHQNPFTALSGNWTGSGKVRFAGGSSEAVSCRAYYTPKEAGTSLGVAILCASPSSKIELRAQLKYDAGKVTGKWEERTYNAAGAVEGQASSSKISVSIVGGGLTGSMAVGINGASQTVQIKTEGIGMTGVDISLSRG